ncbi:MAG: hypothetical protein ACXIUB_02875 [Wenzhouxiangella sp.]
MTRNTLVAGLVLLLATAWPLAQADILLIEKVEQRAHRDLPNNGLRMTEVEARFGQPLERRAAVGDPPITRWVYDDYSVFFEHDRVIDSVLHPERVVARQP